MPTDTDVLVATLSKNAREDLRVTATTYEGHELLDVRVWSTPTTPTSDDARPTKKGLALRPDLWRELLPIIAAAVEEGP